MIAAEAEAFGPGAALVVGVEMGTGANRDWGGGACRWPGGPIPLGYDGALLGRCDSWDSFCSAPPKADFQLGGCSTYSLNRADVGCRDLETNIAQVFIPGQGGYATPTGKEDHPHPNPLTPRRIYDPSEGEGVGHAPPDPVGVS